MDTDGDPGGERDERHGAGAEESTLRGGPAVHSHEGEDHREGDGDDEQLEDGVVGVGYRCFRRGSDEPRDEDRHVDQG